MTTQHFDELVQADINKLCEEAKQRYEAGVPLPPGWPTYAEQRAYWEDEDQLMAREISYDTWGIDGD